MNPIFARFFFVFWCFLGIFFFLACSNQRLEMNEYTFAGKNLNQLEKDYGKKIAEHPTDLNSRYSYAYILYTQKKLNPAFQQTQILIDQEPFEANYYSLLGQIYFDQKNYISAQQSFTLAIRYRNTLINAHFGLARTLEELKNYSRAKVVIDTALLIDPEYFPLKFLKLRVESKLTPSTSNQLHLIALLQDLKTQARNSVEVSLTLSQLYQDIGRLQNAINVLNQYTTEFGWKLPIQEKLCQLYVDNYQLVEAKEVVKKSKTESVEFFRCSILSDLFSGQVKQAESRFQAGKNRYDNQGRIQNTAITILLYNEKYTEALKILESNYFESKSDDFDFIYLIAYVHHQLKNYSAELPYLNQALAIQPNNIDANLLKIDWLLKMGRKEEAYNSFFSASYPLNNPKTLETQGDIYFDQENYTQAENLYTLSKRLQFRPEVEIKLANLDFLRKNYSSATTRLKNLLSITSRSNAAESQLIQNYYLLGQYKEAIKILKSKNKPEEKLDLGLFYGLSLMKTNQSEEALLVLKKTASYFPYDERLIHALTDLLGREKKYQEAISYLEILLSQRENQPVYLYEKLSNYYQAINQTKESANALYKYYQR